MEPGHRERKKQQRRRRIEEAALGLFQRNGFAATTIEEIATAADIAPRTFFSYFDTKDDVALADYSARLERIISELDQRPADEPPWTALRASFRAVAADYEQHADALAQRFALINTNPTVYARSLQLQAGWERTVTDAPTRRLSTAPDDPLPALLAAAALAAMRASLHHWITTGRGRPLPALVDDAFNRLATGLNTDA